MTLKRILVRINKVLTGITGGLLALVFGLGMPSRKKKLVRIPLAINVLVIAILLIIIAAYGGAFSKKATTNQVPQTHTEVAV